MLRRLLALLLLLLFYCPSASADDSPVLRLLSPRLNYFISKEATLELKDASGSILSSSVLLRYRGSTSAFYEGKRNYRLTLTDVEGEPLCLSLLGLREDDDWLLDGMYGDLSRLRNRTAMDLWDSLYTLPWCNASGAIHGTLTELWFNDICKGIYALNERLDRKQLQLSKHGGRIYKTINPSQDGVDLTDFSGTDLSLPSAEDQTWYNFEVNWSGDSGNPWSSLVTLWQFVSTADDETFAQDVWKYLDAENCADYYVFINMLGCSDNMCKNMIFCVQDTRKEERLYLIPWDLDASLGRLYDNTEAPTDVLFSNGLFERLLQLPAFCELVRSRYALWRSDKLSLFQVQSAMQTYIDYYETNGHLSLEESCFPEYKNALTGAVIPLSVRDEWSYMIEWLTERYTFLDGLWL